MPLGFDKHVHMPGAVVFAGAQFALTGQAQRGAGSGIEGGSSHLSLRSVVPSMRFFQLLALEPGNGRLALAPMCDRCWRLALAMRGTSSLEVLSRWHLLQVTWQLSRSGVPPKPSGMM